MSNAFEQLMREADKPTQVPEQIAKYAAALVAGTHEITSLTIRPKRTWVGLTDDEIYSVLENLQVMHHRPPTTDSRVIFALAVEAKLKEKNT